MSPTRREFLKTSGSAALSTGMLGAIQPSRVCAEPDNKANAKPVLVAVYLRGGADPLNTIVPYGDAQYYDVRPTIAIGANRVHRLNKYFGFHQSLQPLFQFWQQGMLAPIVNVGSPHSTRSHFDAQDFMERAAPGIRSITEGWLNRYLSATRGGSDSYLRALSLQPVLPRSLRGQYPALAVPPNETKRAMDMFMGLYDCRDNKQTDRSQMTRENNRPVTPVQGVEYEHSARQKIVAAGGNTIRQLRELRRILHGPSPWEAKYPNSYFAQQLRNLARVIKADQGLEVAALDYRGWDHHAFQGGAEGTMANMLRDLSASLAAFATDLGTRINQTLVLLMSEFGRTVKENGNNGSDHGHGGFMLALGGMVRGKKFYGRWTGLDPASLYERRDLPVTTDFRMVFAETLQSLFHFNSFEHNFFPGYQPRAKPLNFLTVVPASA